MLGRIYRYVTLLLGMKPGQHEYKVMGLAPYGSKYHGSYSYEHFQKYNKLKGIKILRNKSLKDIYFTSKKILASERFDGIAWGLQKFTEDFLYNWVSNCIKKYKINEVLLSGGVAQNIKAIKYLNEKKNIKSVWAGPISGDGSLAIGAGVILNKRLNKTKSMESLSSPFLGSKISDNDVDKQIQKKCKNFKIIKNPRNSYIARLLSKGFIIARCKGRMEFGQRALGNRSILADQEIIII